MALSRVVLKELNGELATLRQRREALDACIQGIELLLSSQADELSAKALERAEERRLPQVARRHRPKRGSLRRRLIELLSQSNGMKTRDLFERLDAERFQIGGKSSLRERVTHELSRLHRLGAVKKNGSEEYVVGSLSRPALVPKAQSEGHAAAL